MFSLISKTRYMTNIVCRPVNKRDSNLSGVVTKRQMADARGKRAGVRKAQAKNHSKDGRYDYCSTHLSSTLF